MAKKKKEYSEEDGVWRTIAGRRVFIRKGQSLSDAMKESGKFKTTKSGNVRREDVVKGKAELMIDFERENQERLKKLQKNAKTKKDKKDYTDIIYESKQNENESREYLELYDNPKSYSGIATDELLAGKHVNKTPESGGNATKDFLKGEKERYKAKMDKASKDWATLYGESKWNSPDADEWHKELDRLKEVQQTSYDKYKESLRNYSKLADESELSWQDKVALNDFERDEKAEKIKQERGKGQYMFHEDKWQDDYYGTYEDYERKNAKIKEAGAKPDEKYEPISSYYSMREKNKKLSGDKYDNEGNLLESGHNKWTGKEYTNDEFIEHLEDANWHTERRMLLTSDLTNREMEYIKNKTKLDSYGAELDKKSTQKLIDEAKAKFRTDVSPMSEWSDTTRTGFSDLQSTTLKNRYKGTYEYLKNTKNMNGADILELLKKIDEDRK